MTRRYFDFRVVRGVREVVRFFVFFVFFVLDFFAQRAWMAARAMRLRSALLTPSQRALPPRFPPLLPHTSIDQFREYLHRQGQVDDLKNFTTENVRGFIVDSSERGLKASSLNTKLAALSALGDYCVKTRGARGYLLDENR